LMAISLGTLNRYCRWRVNGPIDELLAASPYKQVV
jgi:hypothetical protein